MSIQLPHNINYNLFYSKNGCSTKYWGPAAWNFLFTSIIGRYPIKITKSIEDLEIKENFKNLFLSLPIILPCIFCRNSFKEFLKALPLEPFLVGRIELMYWLYLMKDKVNKKLICQETICYNEEKKRLKQLFYNKQISKDIYYKQIKQFKSENFVTIPSPPFRDVLLNYEKYRAKCNKKAKKCI
jgi:hypothetical protein